MSLTAPTGASFCLHRRRRARCRVQIESRATWQMAGKHVCREVRCTCNERGHAHLHTQTTSRRHALCQPFAGCRLCRFAADQLTLVVVPLYRPSPPNRTSESRCPHRPRPSGPCQHGGRRAGWAAPPGPRPAGCASSGPRHAGSRLALWCPPAGCSCLQERETAGCSRGDGGE
jgi:hypothetical protein